MFSLVKKILKERNIFAAMCVHNETSDGTSFREFRKYLGAARLATPKFLFSTHKNNSKPEPQLPSLIQRNSHYLVP